MGSSAVLDTYLADLRRVAGEIDDVPSPADYHVYGDYPLHELASEAGGINWWEILTEADIPFDDNPDVVQTGVPMSAYFEWIREYGDTLDRPVRADDIRECCPIGPKTRVVKFNFSMNSFIALAGPKAVPDTRLTLDLQRVAAELERAPTRAEYHHRGKFDPVAQIHRFGSWQDALAQAERTPVSDTPLDQSAGGLVILLQDLVAVREWVGGELTPDAYDVYGDFTVETCLDHFETWDQTRRFVTGCMEKKHGSISGFEVLRDIQRVADEIDRQPAYDDYSERGEHSMGTCQNWFGSWPNAAYLAGVRDTPTNFG